MLFSLVPRSENFAKSPAESVYFPAEQERALRWYFAGAKLSLMRFCNECIVLRRRVQELEIYISRLATLVRVQGSTVSAPTLSPAQIEQRRAAGKANVQRAVRGPDGRFF